MTFENRFPVLSEDFDRLGGSDFTEPRTASLAIKIRRSTNSAITAAAKAGSQKKTALAEGVLEELLKANGFLR